MFGLRDAADSKNGDERIPAPILKLLADQLQCARTCVVPRPHRRLQAPP